jgi:molybdopterin-guanine dinucleotide biosynthesis protein A
MTPAYILAGGRSSRFGSDKALADVDGVPLVRRVADAAADAGCPVIVVADVADKYAHLGLTTIADEVPDLGPLGGLCTALRHAGEVSHIVVLSCDLYGVSSEWVRALCAALATADVVLFNLDPPQPLLGRYATGLLEAALHARDHGRRAMRDFVAGVGVHALAAPEGVDALRNINRVGDLEGVQRAQGRIPLDEPR